MTLFSRRRPPQWGLLLAGVIFGSLALYALATGEAYSPGGRHSPSRHFLRVTHPDEYAHELTVASLEATVLLTLALLRFNPVEEAVARLHRRLRIRLRTDTQPAPVWAYVVALACIGLIVWIGRKTMYSD